MKLNIKGVTGLEVLAIIALSGVIIVGAERVFGAAKHLVGM